MEKQPAAYRYPDLWVLLTMPTGVEWERQGISLEEAVWEIAPFMAWSSIPAAIKDLDRLLADYPYPADADLEAVLPEAWSTYEPARRGLTWRGWLQRFREEMITRRDQDPPEFAGGASRD